MKPLEPLLTFTASLNAALTEPLAPCPFCGSANVTLYGARLFQALTVLCLNCAAQGPEARTPAEAAERWRYYHGP